MSIFERSFKGKVMTVRGLIEAEEMGITLPHEHLLFHHTPDDLVLSDPTLAAEELMEFSRAGGKTVVELTNLGIRRDAIGLRYISDKTGVNIIMGCGYYKDQWHPPDMDEKTVEEIAEEMVKDITDGVGNTGIRAGIIGEIGISSLTANEKKSVIASAKAQLETGVAINLHFDIGTKEELRMHVLDILEGEGVDLNRVITCHFRACMDEIDYHERMAQRGTYVEYDLFGQEAPNPSMPMYEQESATIKELIGRGFLERILISQDVCYKKCLVRNGGWGYAHILNNVVPEFRKNGITDEEVRIIMVENPKRVIPFSSKEANKMMKDTDIRYKETRKLASAMVMSLDGFDTPLATQPKGEWLLATDSQNIGREQKWYAGAVSEAKPTRVPWIIQEAFPGYHGVAWYWRDFVPPANPHPKGRYLLRFWAVDYLAEVWLNGRNVGGHEGSEGPFVLDVTDAIKPKESNLLAVRVLNPTNEPIDDIALPYIPHRCKVVPFRPGALYNDGGIVDSVELIVAPAVQVADLYVCPDPNTGTIHIQASVRNSLPKSANGHFEFTVAPATSGETFNAAALDCDLPPGDTLIESKLQVDNPRLWNLNDPYLYRVTARVWTEGSNSFDEHSTRCGFRDFRFENGYFQLNGRRIFLKSSHTATHYPIGLHWPHDADLARRELLDMKVMGFNSIRFFCSLPARYQLDLCDEIGFMIYEESFAGWFLEDSPKMGERFDREITEMIKRDRNHPCVVMWGLLNENPDGPVFRHAAGMLPLVRSLDDTRVVMLNSGRFDGVADIGSLSNPGSTVWENVISDQHPYKRVPHTAGIIRELRTASGGENPVFISEYGIGSSLDLSKMTRQYEQLGAERLEDAQWYRERLDRFMVDWKRWHLADTFASPEDYFTKCLARMGQQRLLGLNAIRSNPNVVAYSMTGTTDCGDAGEGVITLFRDLKPGTVDCMSDGWYPLRWCLFVEPVNVYRKTPVRLEAVLANEDMLLPGEYPVRLQVIGPNAVRAFEKTITITIPHPESMPPPAFAIPVFSEDVVIDGPAGRYRFLATFEKGGAAAGGDVEFYVADPAEMPLVETEVVLWGEDSELAKWLADHGIHVRAFSPDRSSSREVILTSSSPAAPGGAEAFKNLACRIAQGSTVIFLSPVVFAKGEQPAAWVPLVNKGTLEKLPSWLYHKDEWAKNHPIFDGLPAGGLMDYTFYREIIPDIAWTGQDSPTEVVAGAINTSIDYSAGLFVSVNTLGAGRFVLNTLHIRENLSRNPVAGRLLLNMLRYAARNVNKPLADLQKATDDFVLPTLDFDAQIKAMGYQ